ncbi:MAG TPA: hypothetical protein VMV89_03675 [Candidatus Paceibacterota bacterium]|nr:hypothetical protein [Candidatus Paceibacterota bacterium]
MKTIEFLSVVFASCTLLSVFYWQVFHFVILKRIRFQLFELRDEARRIAAKRGLGESDSFKHIERFICKSISFAPNISLTSFLMFSAFYRKQLSADDAIRRENNKFEVEAPNELVSIKQSTAKFSILIMAFNSPCIVLFAFFLALVMVALGKISRIGLYRDAEKFVENIQPEDGVCFQPA